MAEYIEREAAVSIIEAKQKELCPAGNYGRHYVYGAEREKFDNWEEIIDALDGIPVADVAPVRHGRWIIRKGENYNGHMECSECHIRIRFDFHSYEKTKYCSRCGAKMDGETAC